MRKASLVVRVMASWGWVSRVLGVGGFRDAEVVAVDEEVWDWRLL